MADGNDFTAGANGDGQDLCSYFASFVTQRQSIERLLNWLRQSQTACTDTTCFDDVNGLPGSEYGMSLENPSFGTYSNDIDPSALVLWLFVGLLTLFAMNLARDSRTPTATKNNKNSARNGANFRRNDDDDNNRPTT